MTMSTLNGSLNFTRYRCCLYDATVCATCSGTDSWITNTSTIVNINTMPTLNEPHIFEIAVLVVGDTNRWLTKPSTTNTIVIMASKSYNFNNL